MPKIKHGQRPIFSYLGISNGGQNLLACLFVFVHTQYSDDSQGSSLFRYFIMIIFMIFRAIVYYSEVSIVLMATAQPFTVNYVKRYSVVQVVQPKKQTKQQELASANQGKVNDLFLW